MSAPLPCMMSNEKSCNTETFRIISCSKWCYIKKNTLGADPLSPFFRTYHRLIKVVCNQPEDVVDIKLKIKKIVIQGILR